MGRELDRAIEYVLYSERQEYLFISKQEQECGDTRAICCCNPRESRCPSYRSDADELEGSSESQVGGSQRCGLTVHSCHVSDSTQCSIIALDEKIKTGWNRVSGGMGLKAKTPADGLQEVQSAVRETQE